MADSRAGGDTLYCLFDVHRQSEQFLGFSVGDQCLDMLTGLTDET